jgi:hypothetical protein
MNYTDEERNYTTRPAYKDSLNALLYFTTTAAVLTILVIICNIIYAKIKYKNGEEEELYPIESETRYQEMVANKNIISAGETRFNLNTDNEPKTVLDQVTSKTGKKLDNETYTI